MSKYDSKFVAALALFSSMYDEKAQDPYSIIQEFIKACLNNKKTERFTILEMQKWLNEIYNIDLPQPIVAKALSNLCRGNLLNYKNRNFTCANRNYTNDIENNIEKECQSYNEIINNICGLIFNKSHIELFTLEREDVKNCFYDFLMGRDNYSKYYSEVASIVIKNNFKNLDLIKEGIVVYNGLRYAQEANDKTWKHPICILLDTEYIFDAYGLNGEIWQKIFQEFYNLVQEINKSSFKRYGKNRISIRYLLEIKDEINLYFAQAIRIKKNLSTLIRSDDAMVKIVDNCANESDVLQYKASLFAYLDHEGIQEFETILNQSEIPSGYLYETPELIEKLNRSINTKDGERKNPSYYLKICDYINFLREGHNKRNLEDVSYIFLSRKNVALSVSKEIFSFNDIQGVPFITTQDFITERLWFKLKKPFINSNAVSFSTIARAKIIISNLVQKSIVKEYDDVNNKLKNEKLSLDAAHEYYNDLRSKKFNPENISASNVDSWLSFINADDKYLDFLKTQELLKKKAAEAEKLESRNKEFVCSNSTLNKENNELRTAREVRDKKIAEQGDKIYSLETEKYTRVEKKYLKKMILGLYTKVAFYLIIALTILFLWAANNHYMFVSKHIGVWCGLSLFVLVTFFPMICDRKRIISFFHIKQYKKEIIKNFEKNNPKPIR